MWECKCGSIFLDLNSTWIRVVSLTLWSPYCRGDLLWYHWVGGWRGTRDGLEAVEEKNLLTLQGNETRFVDCSAGSIVPTQSTLTAGSIVATRNTLSAGSVVATQSTLTAGSVVATKSTLSAGSIVATQSTLTAGSIVATRNTLTAGSVVATQTTLSCLHKKKGQLRRWKLRFMLILRQALGSGTESLCFNVPCSRVVLSAVSGIARVPDTSSYTATDWPSLVQVFHCSNRQMLGWPFPFAS
jgi:hypothetical protein